METTRINDESIYSAFINILKDTFNALSDLPLWERWVHCFWLLGPFILLIERSPADIWLTVLSFLFLVKSTWQREGHWLTIFWVRACFVFLAACVFSSLNSELASYALTESVAWFRFPLFAMATVFWLGKDKRLLYGMLLSTALGMIIMTCILSAEFLIVGQQNGRLSWPYGDLVSGNYLAKVGLPVSTVMMALAIGARPRLASLMASFSIFGILISVLAGERINFLLRACSGMLGALMWQPNWKRYAALLIFEALVVISMMGSMPNVQERFTTAVMKGLPTGPHSEYYRVMGAGIKVFETAPVFGVGPATHRELCRNVVRKDGEFRCDNHPHNFYIQFLTETGIVGLMTGGLMLFSIVWSAFTGFRQNRKNVVAATAFVIPLAFFFPIQSTADFFGQWNNIFMWSSIALALASAKTLGEEI